MGISVYLIGAHLWTWILMPTFYLGGHSDFRQLYTGGYMIRTAHSYELYDLNAQKKFEDLVVSVEADPLPMPINHPTYIELLFSAFSFLPYRSAYWAFLAFNVGLLVATYRLLRRHLDNLAGIVSWLPWALFLGFLPVAFALVEGQDSILFLALASGAFVMLERGKEQQAGLLIGAGLFRPQIALPIALLFLAWRRWKFVQGFGISALAATLVSLWIMGLKQVNPYARILLYMGTSSPRHGYPLVIQRMANLHGLTYGLLGGLVSPGWISGLSLLVTLIWLAWFGLRYRFRGSDALLLAISIVAVGSYHQFMHDMSVLLLPVVLQLDRTVSAEGVRPSNSRLLFRLAALLFVSQLCMSFAPEHFYLVVIPLAAFSLYSVRCYGQHELAPTVTHGAPVRQC